MPPVVGITQCLDDRGRWRADRDYVYLDLAYARAVEDAGGLPVHVPVQGDAKAIVQRIDALILPGGDDFLPAPPQPPYPARVDFDPAPTAQVEFDGRLLQAALEAGKPVLGICYGMQLLALRNGGALYYDLPTDLPDAGLHQLEEKRGRHALEVEAGTRLAEILGESVDPVNSLHHQAVSVAGEGARVTARSPDGVIEAIELEGANFAVGVQWHPEKLDGAARVALFRALVQAC